MRMERKAFIIFASIKVLDRICTACFIFLTASWVLYGRVSVEIFDMAYRAVEAERNGLRFVLVGHKCWEYFTV